MQRYYWKGEAQSGEHATGVIAAPSPELVAARLRRRRIRPLEIAPESARRRRGLRRKPADKVEIATFTRELAVMLAAGVPLVESLEMLGSDCDNRAFADVIDNIRLQVEAGSSFARALSNHPRVFDELYCNIVAAGETSGSLETLLESLADYIEKMAHLRSAVRSAALYPAIVVGVAIAVLAIIMVKVIPTFANIYAALNAQLPLPTRVMVAVSRVLATSFPFVALGAVLFVIAFRQFYRTDTGERIIDGSVLRAPVFGMLLRKIAIARLCRTLGLLTTAGVTILESLEITAKTAGNRRVSDAVLAARRGVESGGSMAALLKSSGVFPALVTHMIKVGEQTGELEVMLDKIAEFYQKQVDMATENLLKLIEPLMIVFLGVIIGTIVVSMYLPIFSLIDLI